MIIHIAEHFFVSSQRPVLVRQGDPIIGHDFDEAAHHASGRR
jgi:hypothetical protein